MTTYHTTRTRTTTLVVDDTGHPVREYADHTDATTYAALATALDDDAHITRTLSYRGTLWTITVDHGDDTFTRTLGPVGAALDPVTLADAAAGIVTAWRDARHDRARARRRVTHV